MKLYIDPVDLKAQYAACPAWLKKLMDAYADGLNWYRATHPQVKPGPIARFEPWMALAFSDGSSGGDIESIDLKGLEAFHGAQLAQKITLTDLGDAGNGFDPEPRGSNGFAIAPARIAIIAGSYNGFPGQGSGKTLFQVFGNERGQIDVLAAGGAQL